MDQNGTELSINKEISEYVDSLIAEYEENKAASEKEEGDVHYAVSNTYEVTHDGEQYFSMYMAAMRIMGSGSETYQTYTIDKKTGEAVSLGELLGNEETLKLVSENISAQMEEQMKEDASVVYFQASEGGFSGLKGDESFYLNQDALWLLCLMNILLRQAPWEWWNSRFPQRQQALSDNDFDQLNSHQVGCSDISMPSFF
mgnify:CR=1 FL=1